MSKRAFWTKAASITLAATLGAVACAPAFMTAASAWATVEYGTGQITISKVEGNGDITYDGYQIFQANVASDANHSATNLAWKDDATKTAVESALSDWGDAHEKTYTSFSAQNAADYITANLKSADASGDTTGVGSDSLGQAIAKKLTAADSKVSPTTDAPIAPGEATTLGEGYWLFVTTPSTTSGSTAGTAGTSPVFYSVVGGSQVKVTEKTSVPRVEKLVKDDDGQNKTVADSFIGQELTYTLTGSVADNIASYDSYEYVFEDELGEGLTPVGEEDGEGGYKLGSNARILAYPGDPNSTRGTKIDSSCYEITYQDRLLKIKFHDLKSLKEDNESTAIEVTGNTHIVITYSAKLNENAPSGKAQPNTVTLEYPNNPVTGGTGKTEATSTGTYTYALNLLKVDKSTEAPLSGAKFTLQFRGQGDTVNSSVANKYVVATKTKDGAYQVTGITANEYDTNNSVKATEFESDSEGKIRINGLNAGSYETVETTSPQGYDVADAFEFTIKPTYDATGTLTKLDNTVTASDFAVAGEPDGDKTDGILKAKTENANMSSTSDGSVTVTVGDVKRIALPFTGMPGVTLTWLAGGAVLLLTIAYARHLSRERRRKQS